MSVMVSQEGGTLPSDLLCLDAFIGSKEPIISASPTTLASQEAGGQASSSNWSCMTLSLS